MEEGLSTFLRPFCFFCCLMTKGGLGSEAHSTSNIIKPSGLIRKRRPILAQLLIRNPIARVSMQPADPSEHPFPRACRWMCSLYRPAGLWAPPVWQGVFSWQHMTKPQHHHDKTAKLPGDERLKGTAMDSNQCHAVMLQLRCFWNKDLRCQR